MRRHTADQVVVEVANAAGIEFPVHPRMLRHATGFYLANAGQDTHAIQLYLGHKKIRHTTAILSSVMSSSRVSSQLCLY